MQEEKKRKNITIRYLLILLVKYFFYESRKKNLQRGKTFVALFAWAVLISSSSNKGMSVSGARKREEAEMYLVHFLQL